MAATRGPSARGPAPFWSWAVPSLLVLVLAAVTVGRVPLWRDEFASRDFALLPLGDLREALGHVDVVFGPWYLLLHGWIDVAGDSAVALRLPSVVAATVAVGVLSRTAGRAFGAAAGCAAGVAMATDAVVVVDAVQARPYALSLLCCALATAVLAGDRPPGRRRWVLYAVLVLLAVAMQVFAVLVLLGHLALAVRDRGRDALRWGLAAVPAVVVAVVLVLLSRGQQAQVSWIEPVGVRGFVDFTLGLTGEDLSGVLVLLAAAVALVARRGRPTPLWWTGVLLWLAPVLVLQAVSVLVQPLLVPRYVVTAPLGIALLIGAGVGALTERAAPAPGRVSAVVSAVVAGAAVVIVALASFPVTTATVRRPFPDWRSMGPAVADGLHVGDLIVVRQQFSEAGLAASVAFFLDDPGFATDSRAALVTGVAGERTRLVVGVDPLRTTPAAANVDDTGRTVVIVGIRTDVHPDQRWDGIRPPGCVFADPSTPAIIVADDGYVVRLRC